MSFSYPAARLNSAAIIVSWGTDKGFEQKIGYCRD